MIDIETSKNFIRSHAKGVYPLECCGLIIKKGEKQEVISCRNVAEKPRHSFVLPPADYAYAEDQGEILAVYHSHCEGSPEPTMADKAMAEANELPVITVSMCKQADGSFNDTWTVYKPTGWKPDLIGRPFVYGVLDCFTLIRDYYSEKLNIRLPDIAYAPDWSRRGQNLYTDHLPANGFVLVPAPLQEHDLILMRLSAQVPDHCAIYTGDGLMLHHPPEHLSGLHPYICAQGYYAKNTVGFYRHKSLLKPPTEPQTEYLQI
jgi:cell wall-associated NlpC family hydrolase